MGFDISQRTYERLTKLQAEERDCRGSDKICLSRATVKEIFEDGGELRMCAKHYAKGVFDARGVPQCANGTVVSVVCF